MIATKIYAAKEYQSGNKVSLVLYKEASYNRSYDSAQSRPCILYVVPPTPRGHVELHHMRQQDGVDSPCGILHLPASGYVKDKFVNRANNES